MALAEALPPALTKRDQWLWHLRAFLFAQLGQPFVYGLTDCHAIVLRGLDQATGQRVSAGITSAYSDSKTALRLARAYGGIEDFLRSRGCYEVTGPLFGDVVIFDRLNGDDTWRLGAPAWSMGGGRVMMPLRDQSVAIVPMYAVGWIKTTLRVPLCRRQ